MAVRYPSRFERQDKMRKLIFAAVTAAVIPLVLAVAGDRPSESVSLNFAKISYQKVPAGKKYAVFNTKGKKIADFKAGEKTSMTTDCAQIPCPSSFDKDTVCWKCVERIKAK